MSDRYEVLVGGVGVVYFGVSSKEAGDFFEDYVALSRRGIGRAANAEVALCFRGSPIRFHKPEPVHSNRDSSVSWEVEVSRKSSRILKFSVVAQTEASAHVQAIDLAYNADFSDAPEEDDVVYEITACRELYRS